MVITSVKRVLGCFIVQCNQKKTNEQKKGEELPSQFSKFRLSHVCLHNFTKGYGWLPDHGVDVFKLGFCELDFDGDGAGGSGS